MTTTLPDPCVFIHPRSMPEGLKDLAHEEIYVPLGEVWILSGGKVHRFRLESEGAAQ